MKRIKEFVNPTALKIIYFSNKVNILNYDEIVLLTEEKILLSKDKQIITIKGKNLVLVKVLDNEVLIKGFIKSIEL